MGWTYQNKPKYIKVIDFLKKEFEWENCEVIDGSVVKYRTAYLACRIKSTGRVFAVVCMLDYKRGDYHNFGYKDMDEDMLPFYFDCPKRILNLLTPPETREGKAWRSICKKEMTYQDFDKQRTLERQAQSSSMQI